MAKQPARLSVDCDNIINEYLSGKSVNQLASDIGHSRQVIYRVLRNAGITPRNRSESMFVRMAQTTPEERQRLSAAAHEAKRGYVNSPETRHKMALAKNKRTGIFEAEFIDRLTNAGITVIPQEPFLAYNLDIGCGCVAVEIHTQTASPLTGKHLQKLMNCLHAGRSMIYVWIDPRRIKFSDSCYENVVALVQSVRMNPPSRCKYWVIRGTGETYATGSFDTD